MDRGRDIGSPATTATTKRQKTSKTNISTRHECAASKEAKGGQKAGGEAAKLMLVLIRIRDQRSRSHLAQTPQYNQFPSNSVGFRYASAVNSITNPNALSDLISEGEQPLTRVFLATPGQNEDHVKSRSKSVSST